MRNKLPKILVSFLVAIALVLLIFVTKKLTNKKAGLLVETVPAATVYVNGESIGKTPLDISMDAGELHLKLVPDSYETPLAAYETRLRLLPGVKSVVIRNFASDSEISSGAVMSFESSPGSSGSVAIVSYPESAQVFVEGSSKGFTPLKVDNLSGEVKIKTSIPGYHDKEISVSPRSGYLLTASIDLAKDTEYTTELPEKKTETKEEEVGEREKRASIKILPTPVGFLRVRVEPVNGEEVGQVGSGEEYDYTEIDEESGWYRIVYEDDKSGWVSDDYVEVVNSIEENET